MCPCRAQAALGWLVLNANQLESSHSHPGSIAKVGDFNNHYFFPPPPSSIRTLHSLPTTLKVQVKRTLNNPMSRAAAAAHVKTTLQNLCNQIRAKEAAIFEGHSSLPLPSASISCLALGNVISLRLKLTYNLTYKIDDTVRWQVRACPFCCRCQNGLRVGNMR